MPPTPNDEGITVRATVILRIPDLDSNELTGLYKTINEIVKTYGGEYEVSTSPETPKTS